MGDPRELGRDYLKSVKMMQLAVVSDGEPWVCTLYYAIDENMNMYWISLPETQHSQAIEKNSSAAVAVPVHHEYGKPIAGLSIKGAAKQINDLENNRELLELYKDQMGREDSFVDDMVTGENPHKLYVFTPEKFKLFDRINFESGSEIHEWSVS